MALTGLFIDPTFSGNSWNLHCKIKIGWLLLRGITISGYTFVHAHIFLVNFLKWQVMEIQGQQRVILSKVYPGVVCVKAGIVLPPRQGQRGAAVSRRHTPEVDCVISGGDHDILWALVNRRWNFGINSKRNATMQSFHSLSLRYLTVYKIMLWSLWYINDSWDPWWRHDMETLCAILALFYREILQSRWIPLKKGLCCSHLIFPFMLPWTIVEQTVKSLVIWDALVLMWRHCYVHHLESDVIQSASVID